MSKTLVLIQLQRMESETRTTAVSLLSSTTDLQLCQLLKRAELEHGYRAKQLQRELDSIYGSTAWKEQMFSEHCGIAKPAEQTHCADVLEAADAAELRLNKLYEMATELVHSRTVTEAAAEQAALYKLITELKTQKTLKMPSIRVVDFA